MSAPLLEIRGLTRTFGGGRRWFRPNQPGVQAIQGIDLDVMRGETLGIVGESGCGKSTLARLLVGLDTPSNGTIHYAGDDLQQLRSQDRHALARRIQYVFQDPLSSLNPRKRIRDILAAPLYYLRGLEGQALERRLGELMEMVNLRPEFISRYPHEFSGGQAQRIGIARALAGDPELLVLDEPVSALDVSIQAQVLQLLRRLKDELDLTYLFISHDLSVVETISDRIAVMYFGRIIEQAPTYRLFRSPSHPYTRVLLDSAPIPGGPPIQAEAGTAELPDPLAPPPGCAFAPRCSRAQEDCRQAVPPLDNMSPDGDHRAACIHPIKETWQRIVTQSPRESRG
ncbi:ABC transporter ATP-binding protein [Aidingimonas halophila]|uniref:Peptide/nickel transport system ATP-binding protein n=1 Tax=Aidingimonas halophila TaxID=574349 RepID=A0A1H2RRS3_9GAMM|nr:oligopeptide/dipeptide ABC transporter ATP-binding protein [Aidingimonas halophila]GHC18820.1 peptide ABC transporter ATP-binding protein [Aidingimonas halophila]SDW21995.1 peptide/nickel transport system ATP-binding protein [Aidingimonas halophila]